jgi:hypothetical protein
MADGVNPLAAIQAGLGAVGGIFGGIGSAQQQKWENDFAINLLNRNDGAYNRSYEDWLRQMTPLMFGAQGAGANAQANMQDPNSAGANLAFAQRDMWNQSSPYNANNIMSQFGQQYNTPTTEGAQWNLGQLGGQDGRSQSIGQTAAQGFQGGGWTPQRQQYLDALAPLMQGQTPAQQQALMSGLGLMQNNGSTGRNDIMMDRGVDAVQYGGSTPWLEGLIENLGGVASQNGQTKFTQNGLNQAGNIINSGGYDPQISDLLGSANSMFKSGGRTPNIDAGSNTALSLFNKEALMSPEQAASFATDNAGQASKKAYEAVQRHALARGGGPGSVVAAGNSTGASADFADQAAAAKSAALADAMKTQQGLQLQQRGMGGDVLGSLENAATGKMNSAAGMAGSALGTAANRLGTGFSGTSSLSQAETQRLMEALGMVSGAQNSATSRAGTLGNLGLQADQNNNQRLGLGAGMLQNNTANSQGFLNGLNSMMDSQGQYALGLGGLGNTSAQTQASILNSLFGNEQTAANTGLSRAGMFGGLANNQFQNGQAGFNAQSNLLQGSWNPLTSLAGQSMDLSRQGLSNLGLSAAPTAGNNSSVWSSALGGLAGGSK